MSSANSNYYIAIVCIILPVVIVLLLLLCLYILYSRRFQLNWYDRTLLEESAREQTTTFIRISDEKGNVRTLGESLGVCGRTRGRQFNRAAGTGSAGIRKPLDAILEVIKSLKKLSTRWKSSAADCGMDAVTENGKDSEWIICSKRQNGSNPNSPTNESMEQAETFWVPPTVVERKRAHSLVPTTTQRTDSDEGRWNFLLNS